MHPFGVEHLAEAKMTELIGEADAVRLARTVPRRRGRRRGLGIARRISRRVDRRRLRDVAI